MSQYQIFYNLAYDLAEIAFSNDEVPVGAVIINDETQELVSSSYNQMRFNKSSLDFIKLI